ncbi:hypothetical protein [Pseudomonas sp.]|uniref:hypothetical protein n=1 Tax=Pseudomonas sp. TaxID=306 RepID=UPI0029131762|nr:hypothetical protein [Pseudomonas sp.]MDU4254525.1 hypothetical protein [Pseudomonas sp.]
MRGNHLHLGRQDYTEPAALGAATVAEVERCVVTTTHGKKTWRDVHLDGVLLGRVRTGSGGQWYRLPDDEEWRYCAGDWNHADPEHGHAIAALLKNSISNQPGQ